MSRKKPGIGLPAQSAQWSERISECVEVIMGRRGGRVKKAAVTAQKVSAGPTATEFNLVIDDLNAMKARFNELLEQVQD